MKQEKFEIPPNVPLPQYTNFVYVAALFSALNQLGILQMAVVEARALAGSKQADLGLIFWLNKLQNELAGQAFQQDLAGLFQLAQSLPFSEPLQAKGLSMVVQQGMFPGITQEMMNSWAAHVVSKKKAAQLAIEEAGGPGETKH
jgi:hypothetical protein